MLIVKLFQGFGNQMFQYAYGRSIASRYNKTVKFDLGWFKENSAHRAFMLNSLNVTYECATVEEIYDTKTCNGRNIIEYKWNLLRNAIAPYYRKSVIIENSNTCFDTHLLKTNSNSYIEGYFASENYFIPIADLLKKEFKFKTQPSELNKCKMQEMQQRNAVCISLRRGDFLQHSIHNVCGLDYFDRSIEYLNQRITDSYFYIFSDDNAWATENFKTDFPHEFVTHNYPNFIEDFRLMQVCKHHIIPNSTFSWWAAWLAEQDGSIIIAPNKWLNSETIDYSKVVPLRWIKMEN